MPVPTKSAFQALAEYSEYVSKLDPKGYNYYSLNTRAAKKARLALSAWGYNAGMSVTLIQDAYEMGCLMRNGGAR